MNSGQKQLQSVRVGIPAEPWEGNWSRCHGGLGSLPGSLWLIVCSLLPNHSSVQEDASPGVPMVPFSQMCQVTARLLSTITVFKLKNKLVVEGLKPEPFCSGTGPVAALFLGLCCSVLWIWLDLGPATHSQMRISLVWPQNEKFANVGCKVIVITLTREPKRILCWF